MAVDGNGFHMDISFCLFVRLGSVLLSLLAAEIVVTFDLQRKKTYLLTCPPNEDSDLPVHPHSLIRVFVVRMKLCILAIQNALREDSDQTVRMRRLI